MINFDNIKMLNKYHIYFEIVIIAVCNFVITYKNFNLFKAPITIIFEIPLHLINHLFDYFIKISNH